MELSTERLLHGDYFLSHCKARYPNVTNLIASPFVAENSCSERMQTSGPTASTQVGEIVSIDAPGEGPFGMRLDPGAWRKKGDALWAGEHEAQ